MTDPKNDNAPAGTVASVKASNSQTKTSPTHETRQAAFKRSRFGEQTHSQTIMKLIAEKGAHGLTDDEGQDKTGIPVQSWTPARHKLASLGLIVPLPGVTRPTRLKRQAVVWVLPQYAPKPVTNSEPSLFDGGAD